MARFTTQDSAANIANKNEFTCKLDNAKVISQLLKAVHYKDYAVFCCSESGMKVTVEDMKCVQLNAFIQKEIFQSFRVTEESVQFKLSLSVLLECLNIFGSGVQASAAPALKMSYAGHGHPLVLLLEESGVVTDCKVNTVECEQILDYNFTTANVINKIIMNSECLKEIFSELDATSDVVQLQVSPNPPHFRITTFGTSGICHTDIPKDSTVIEVFHSTATVSYKYKLSLLKPSIKPLGIAEKVSIRMDDTGLLCFQVMIKTEENQTCFLEFFCPADVDLDEEE